MAIEKSKFFLEMDALDQQQIVLAATSEVAKELVYRVHGRDGLSWAGINHIAFWMGDIVIEPWVEWSSFEMGDAKYWSATVRAVNEKYNLASLGTAEAPEFMEVYDRDPRGKKIPDGRGGFKKHLELDTFCRRKALSMAQRNAKKAVIPAAVLTKWMGYFLDLKAGKKVVPPFKPKTVDADYKVVSSEPGKDEHPETEKIREQARRDREERLAKEKDAVPPTEEPAPEEIPQVPTSVEAVRQGLENILGLDDLLVISEYDAFFRVGKKQHIDDELEYTINGLIERMGGSWDKESNCWRIPKEEG